MISINAIKIYKWRSRSKNHLVIKLVILKWYKIILNLKIISQMYFNLKYQMRSLNKSK